jgi:glutathione S-transferase
MPADADARACVERFLAGADGLFLEVLTYGEIPGVRKPLLMRRAAKGTHAGKLARLDAKLREHGDDPLLRAAYAAKRCLVEETSSAMNDPAETAAIVEATAATIAEVAEQLEAGPFASGGWLCDDAFSLADLEWGIVLYRLRWLGLAARLWGSRPVIERYAARLFARPAFKSAVVDWDRPVRDLILPLLAARLRAALGR